MYIFYTTKAISISKFRLSVNRMDWKRRLRLLKLNDNLDSISFQMLKMMERIIFFALTMRMLIWLLFVNYFHRHHHRRCFLMVAHPIWAVIRFDGIHSLYCLRHTATKKQKRNIYKWKVKRNQRQRSCFPNANIQFEEKIQLTIENWLTRRVQLRWEEEKNRYIRFAIGSCSKIYIVNAIANEKWIEEK